MANKLTVKLSDSDSLGSYLEQGLFEPLDAEIPGLPLPDELHVKDWLRYRELCAEGEEFTFLSDRLEQLKFPIRDGIHESKAYKNVVRRGERFSDQAQQDRLVLDRPEQFTFQIYGHPAGRLPVLETTDRDDFERLYCALGNRSEPQTISSSVNAQTVAGLNNWHRVRRYRKVWENDHTAQALTGGWSREMKRVISEQPGTFRDRVMLIYVAPYSGMSPSKLGLDCSDSEWLELSRTIRIDHEFTHYLTKRIFGTMNKHLWDELLADFMGLTEALGEYHANLFLRLIGIVDGQLRDGARFHTYTQGLSSDDKQELVELLSRASRHIEVCYRLVCGEYQRIDILLAIARCGFFKWIRDDCCETVEKFLSHEL